MPDFISPDWRGILASNGLDTFDALWEREVAWFEPPNLRRGGWSGVGRLALPSTKGESAEVFIKRQENHTTRSWRHPIQGEPTFAREYRRIAQYQRLGIATLTPVYYGQRKEAGTQRAILVTAALTGYTSLAEITERWLHEGAPDSRTRQALLAAVAGYLRNLHMHRLQHSCFFPKHIFVRPEGQDRFTIRVIDLEKSRRRPFRTLCALRDLYCLFCESQSWRRGDMLYFIKTYLQLEKLTPYARWMIQHIVRHAERKQRIPPATPKLCYQPLPTQAPGRRNLA